MCRKRVAIGIVWVLAFLYLFLYVRIRGKELHERMMIRQMFQHREGG